MLAVFAPSIYGRSAAALTRGIRPLQGGLQHHCNDAKGRDRPLLLALWDALQARSQLAVLGAPQWSRLFSSSSSSEIADRSGKSDGESCSEEGPHTVGGESNADHGLKGSAEKGVNDETSAGMTFLDTLKIPKGIVGKQENAGEKETTSVKDMILNKEMGEQNTAEKESSEAPQSTEGEFVVSASMVASSPRPDYFPQDQKLAANLMDLRMRGTPWVGTFVTKDAGAHSEDLLVFPESDGQAKNEDELHGEELYKSPQEYGTVAQLETGKQKNRPHCSRNQLTEVVELGNFYCGSANGVQEKGDVVSSCDSADRDRSVHKASETLPKSPVLSEVLTVLNNISKTDDLSCKLGPYEGKISFRDGTTIMKLMNDKRLCFSFYMWLKQQANFTPDLASLLTVIRFLLLVKKWEKLIHVTQDLYDSGFEFDNATYCRIIKEASLSGNITVCDWWFQKMKARGCWPDQTTYNTMIHAHALARMPEKSFAIFDEMKEMGVKPDINTFCHLLNACQRTGNPGTAHSFFLQMRNYGLTPDLVTYSILLDTYGKEGKATEAAGLFKEMQDAGVMADAKAYNCLIHAYGKAGMMDLATSTFNEYQKVAAQNPDKVIFWTMLHLYSKSGLLKQALAVKRMMRVANIPVDASCYATIIDGFRRQERWEDATRAFKEMQRYKYPIGEGMYGLMMKIYSKAGHHVECERIFDQMIAKGFKARVDMYEIMINIYKRTNHIINATRIYEQMKRNNCNPSRNICNTMIHIYAKAGMLPACEKIAEEMGSVGIKPNKSTFLTLIRAYTSYGQYFSAMDMYDVMQEAGIKPDYELSELIVEVLLKTGQVQKVEKFLKEIIAAGINPNKRMVSAVLRAGGVVELSKPLAISKTRSPD